MKKNVGKTDKLIRLFAGVLFALGAVFYTSGVLQIILGVAAFLMFFTAYTSWCYLYTLLGINTCSLGTDNKEKDKTTE